MGDRRGRIFGLWGTSNDVAEVVVVVVVVGVLAGGSEGWVATSSIHQRCKK